jgi:hypothetical protein
MARQAKRLAISLDSTIARLLSRRPTPLLPDRISKKVKGRTESKRLVSLLGLFRHRSLTVFLGEANRPRRGQTIDLAWIGRRSSMAVGEKSAPSSSAARWISGAGSEYLTRTGQD